MRRLRQISQSMSNEFEPGNYTMAQAIDRFFFGLCFGMGFAVANAVLAFIVAILGKGVH